jgi:hypothetical protein
MKQQTAVEFAVEKLEKFIPSGNQLAVLAILEQAREMEKQQIIDAYYIGADEESDNHGYMYTNKDKSEQYYNKTYKNE